MSENFYQLDLPARRRRLADQGFVRDVTRVWRHFDGRAIGEGVAAALTDVAFCRFLHVQFPVGQPEALPESLADTA